MGTGDIGQQWPQLLNEGIAMIAGLVSASGEPVATFAWGLTVEPDRTTCRVLLPAVEVDQLGYPDGDPTGAMLAVNCTEIRSLRSLQLKGPIIAIGPIDDADLVTRDLYCERYFDAVLVVDLISRHLMERMIPDELVAATFTVAEAYDQTPGPGAGQPVELAAP